MKYEIKTVPSFVKELKKLAKKYKSIKTDYQKLLETLSKNPKENAIPLGKNCYKLRLRNSDNKKGKSGGYRVIYIVIDENFCVTLLSIYSKSEIENISENLIDSKIIESIS